MTDKLPKGSGPSRRTGVIVALFHGHEDQPFCVVLPVDGRRQTAGGLVGNVLLLVRLHSFQKGWECDPFGDMGGVCMKDGPVLFFCLSLLFI